MAQTISHHHTETVRFEHQVPDIAAGRVVVQRMLGDAVADIVGLERARVKPGQDRRAALVGMYIEYLGQA